MSAIFRLYWSPQSCDSVWESTSSDLMTSMSPRWRIRPVTTARACTSRPTSQGSRWPLYRNTTDRGTTRSPVTPDNLFMMLSEIPSPRYSLSASPDTLVKGSTASESRGSRPEGVVTTGVSMPIGDRAGSVATAGAWLVESFGACADGAGAGCGAGFGTERVNTERKRFHSDSVLRSAIVAELRL